MTINTGAQDLDPHSREFYIHTLQLLQAAEVPFLVGGAYAFQRYTGIVRDTKDLDIFVREQDLQRSLDVLSAAGYQSEVTFPHWLGKAFSGDHFVDIIFRSGNGVSVVDDAWFAHAVADEVLGIPVQLCPAEAILWTKLFIMERERFDGADVAHLIRAQAEQLDWPRLLRDIGGNWRVLLSHLILFGFIYPAERERIPAWVMAELLRRLEAEQRRPAPPSTLCRGTLLSRAQYLIDVEEWGYRDARLQPVGNMTPEEIAQWTAAIDDEE